MRTENRLFLLSDKWFAMCYHMFKSVAERRVTLSLQVALFLVAQVLNPFTDAMRWLLP